MFPLSPFNPHTYDPCVNYVIWKSLPVHFNVKISAVLMCCSTDFSSGAWLLIGL